MHYDIVPVRIYAYGVRATECPFEAAGGYTALPAGIPGGRYSVNDIIWIFVWPAAFIYLSVCGIGTWNAGECTLDISFFITADHTMTVGNVLADYLF